MTIFTVPVVLGGGKKLFADGSAPHACKLTRSRVSSTGIMIGHYEPSAGLEIVSIRAHRGADREGDRLYSDLVVPGLRSDAVPGARDGHVRGLERGVVRGGEPAIR